MVLHRGNSQAEISQVWDDDIMMYDYRVGYVCRLQYITYLIRKGWEPGVKVNPVTLK